MKIEWNKVTWYSKSLTAIFLLFIFPSLTFYIGKEYQVDTDNSPSISQIKPITPVIPIHSSDNTLMKSGKKIYIDNQVGFEFEYPASSTMVRNTVTGRINMLSQSGQWQLSIGTTTMNGYVTPITLHSQYKYTYLAYSNMFVAEDGFNSVTPVVGKCPPTRTINGIDFYVSYLSGKYTGGGNDDTDYFIFTDKGYVVNINFLNTDDDGSVEVSNILSSFKLIGGASVAQIKAKCLK